MPIFSDITCTTKILAFCAFSILIGKGTTNGQRKLRLKLSFRKNLIDTSSYYKRSSQRQPDTHNKVIPLQNHILEPRWSQQHILTDNLRVRLNQQWYRAPS